MWLFDNPENYAQMSKKISQSVCFASLFVIYILSCVNEDFRIFVESISFGTKYEFGGIKLNLAMFYIPFLLGIVEHSLKLHNKAQALFKIRKLYDQKIIAKRIVQELGITGIKLDDKKTKKILSIAFYKYASSTNPQIDRHSINQALNGWCWFWIIFDVLLLHILLSVLYLVKYYSWKNLIVVGSVLIILIILMAFILLENKKISHQEIKEILSDKARKNTIRKELEDALYPRRVYCRIGTSR